MPRKTRTWSVAENGSEVLREDPTRVEEALDLRRVQESIVGTTFVDVNVRQRKKERISHALEKMHEAQSEFQVIRDVINLLELGDTLVAVPSEKQSIDHERQHEEAIVTEGRIEKQFKSAADNMRRAADSMRRRAQGKSKFYEEVERLQRAWKLRKTTGGELAFDLGYIPGCKYNRVCPVRRGPDGGVQVHGTSSATESCTFANEESGIKEGYEHTKFILEKEQEWIFKRMLEDELEIRSVEDPSLFAQVGKLRQEAGLACEEDAEDAFREVKELETHASFVDRTTEELDAIVDQLPPCEFHVGRLNKHASTIDVQWTASTWIVVTMSHQKLSISCASDESDAWAQRHLELSGLSMTFLLLFAVQILEELEREVVAIGHCCVRQGYQLHVYAPDKSKSVRVSEADLERGKLVWLVEALEGGDLLEMVDGKQTMDLITHFFFKREIFLEKTTG